MTSAVKVDISNISAAVSNKRTASYGAGSGNPSWVSVSSVGDIDLSNPTQAEKNKSVDLQFNLPTGFTFDSTTPFSTVPASTDFSVVSGKGGTVLTVSDTNNDAVKGTNYEYTLHLNDGTGIDPKVINY